MNDCCDSLIQNIITGVYNRLTCKQSPLIANQTILRQGISRLSNIARKIQTKLARDGTQKPITIKDIFVKTDDEYIFNKKLLNEKGLIPYEFGDIILDSLNDDSTDENVSRNLRIQGALTHLICSNSKTDEQLSRANSIGETVSELIFYQPDQESITTESAKSNIYDLKTKLFEVFNEFYDEDNIRSVLQYEVETDEKREIYRRLLNNNQFISHLVGDLIRQTQSLHNSTNTEDGIDYSDLRQNREIFIAIINALIKYRKTNPSQEIKSQV